MSLPADATCLSLLQLLGSPAQGVKPLEMRLLMPLLLERNTAGGSWPLAALKLLTLLAAAPPIGVQPRVRMLLELLLLTLCLLLLKRAAPATVLKPLAVVLLLLLVTVVGAAGGSSPPGCILLLNRAPPATALELLAVVLLL
jgi:hypothetical protein